MSLCSKCLTQILQASHETPIIPSITGGQRGVCVWVAPASSIYLSFDSFNRTFQCGDPVINEPDSLIGKCALTHAHTHTRAILQHARANRLVNKSLCVFEGVLLGFH